MPFGIVFVNLPILFARYRFVRAVAIRLVFGKAAHADEDRFLLGLNLERLLVGFQDFAHGLSLPLKAALSPRAKAKD
jgi:hypothetical protein